MKQRLAIALILALTVLMLIPWQAAAISTIDSGVDNIVYPVERKSFYYGGLEWVFYCKSHMIYFKTGNTTEGTTVWSSATAVEAVYSENFALYFDGTKVHYAASNDSTYLYYRRGQPYAGNASITWQPQATVASGRWEMVSVVTDSSNYPLVAGYACCGAPSLALFKGNATDGTWGTSTRYDWASTSGYDGMAIMRGGSANYVLWVAAKTGAKLTARYFDGSYLHADVAGTSLVQTGVAATYVAQGDTVDIVFLEQATYDIVHTTYSAATNTFGSETTVYSGATSTSCPALTRDTTNNDLWVFWQNDPLDDYTYMAMYDASEGTWSLEQELEHDSDGISSYGYYLVSDYTAPRANLGLVYSAGTGLLKYKALAEQFDVDTLTPTGVTETEATLRGEILSIGWGTPTERGFYLNTSASLGNSSGTLRWFPEYEGGGFGIGVFTETVGNLTTGEHYYYIAYAYNAEMCWGEWVQFWAGGTEGFTLVTDDPTNVGDTHATFNGRLVSTAAGGATWIGFDWGYTGTPTWSWTTTGTFTAVYTYSYTPDTLDADQIYYVRAKGGNGTVTDYGEWVGLMTQIGSGSGDYGIGNDTGLIPPIPEEPSGWLRPPKDWGEIGLGDATIPLTFFVFLLLTGITVLIGLALTKYVKSLAVLFMVLGMIIGIMSFWPKGGYLDWWILLPYIVVGYALLRRQKDMPMQE